MKTKILPYGEAAIEIAVDLLKKGEAVAIPTETVYGLAANALSTDAVNRIFLAKERPPDNPLITHIADFSALEYLAADIPKLARLLAEAFWPGPLTMVLRRKEGTIPDIVTAGLDTFAVRMPSHHCALELINACGFPLAAPSANRSGKPSPTAASHVYDDLNGLIPLVIDDGPCQIGLESTVLDVTGKPILLRPGGITREQLENVLGVPVEAADGVDKPLADGPVRSPGLLHRHYAPNAPVRIVDSRSAAIALYNEEAARGGKPVLLGATSVEGYICHPIGESEEAAHNLFAALRAADAIGATLVIFESVGESGIGYAIMNRTRRAASASQTDQKN